MTGAVTYHGHRDDDGLSYVLVTRVDRRGHRRSQPLPLRLDLRRHSPCGFEWAYPGSGPAQLALALAVHATGDNWLALRVYQDLKMLVISQLAVEGWELTRDQVLGFVDRIAADIGALRGAA